MNHVYAYLCYRSKKGGVNYSDPFFVCLDLNRALTHIRYDLTDPDSDYGGYWIHRYKIEGGFCDEMYLGKASKKEIYKALGKNLI